jgi:hypothetical protein
VAWELSLEEQAEDGNRFCTQAALGSVSTARRMDRRNWNAYEIENGLCKSKRVSRAFNEVDIAFDFEGQITCVLVCLVIVKISTFYMLLIIEILRYAHLFWIIDSTRSRYIYTTKGLSPDNKSSGNCPVHGYRYS